MSDSAKPVNGSGGTTITIKKNCILLLKAEKAAESSTEEGCSDEFTQLLQLEGFEVKHVKTIYFVFKNLERLLEVLRTPALYSGLILSSPRCVQAIQLALTKHNQMHLLDSWRQRGEGSKTNFSVGRSTQLEAQRLLNLPSYGGDEAGNLKNLNNIIEKAGNWSPDKPFLVPHGNLRTPLDAHHFTVEDVPVYETVLNPNLAVEMAQLTQQFQSIPEVFVFFSPSGVRNLDENAHQIPINMVHIKKIAIGPTTSLALKQAGFGVDGIAVSPTPQEMLTAIHQVLEKK